MRYLKFFSNELLLDLANNNFYIEERSGFYLISYGDYTIYRLKEHEFTIEKMVYFCDKNLYHSSWCKNSTQRKPRKILLELLIPHTREKSIDKLLK